MCLSLYEDESYGKPPRPRYRIKHPYYVKSILVLPVIAPDLAERSLITGSTDEAIRVYDLDENDMATPVSHPWQNDVSSGREIYEQGLGRVVDEHFHEVNGQVSPLSEFWTSLSTRIGWHFGMTQKPNVRKTNSTS